MLTFIELFSCVYNDYMSNIDVDTISEEEHYTADILTPDQEFGKLVK